MRTKVILISLLLGVTAALLMEPLAGEEVYRWVDEDGVVHFDDQPGENKEAVQVDSQSGVGGDQAPAPAYPAKPSEPSLAQQKRDERAERRQEAAEQRSAVEQGCAQARQRVEMLEPSPRVMVENEDGSISRLEDEKRLELLDEAKAFIAKNCDS